MYKLKNKIIICLTVLFFTCDKQSNPFIGDSSIYLQENLMGESRDIIVLEDIEFDMFDCSILSEQDCIDDMWCNFDQSCVSKSNDLLIVANEYQEGLIIYQIIDNNNNISLNKIYQNINFEVIDETSIENDLELRTLLYSGSSEMLYILDKFEYIYNAWLPGLLESTTKTYDAQCYDYDSDLIWDPIPLQTFTDISNLHSTQVVMDESNQDNLDKALYLIKYNSNIMSQQNLPPPLKTSTSKLGAYSFLYDNFLLGEEQVCNGVEFLSEFKPTVSPHFDYNITDVFFKNDKVFIANPYNEFVFKDALGNNLNLSLFDNNDEQSDGCSLPENSVYLTSNGELLYNSQTEIGYFEFNLIGGDLSNYLVNSIDCLNVQDNGNFIQYSSNCFEGEIGSNNNYSVGISGNKVIGYSIIVSSIESNCGTLIDLNTNQYFR